MIIFGLAWLGLCFGSFVNALVYRLHQQQTTKSIKRQARYSILRGRSACVHCGHTLKASDLVPVLSWVWLKGRCRYCRKPISRQYPLVELVTAGLFVLSYLTWPGSLDGLELLTFGLWLLTLVGFMALVVYDLRWMLLPNKIVAVLFGIAILHLVTQIVGSGAPGWELMSAFWGVVIIAGLFYALFRMSEGRWIGGGDVKLAVVLGLLVGGPFEALILIFLASLIGSLVGIPIALRQKSGIKSKLPFGPFLISATIIVYLYGGTVIDWYRSNLLLVLRQTLIS